MVELSKLGDPAAKRLFDTYMTYFRYDDTMAEYFDNNIVTSKRGKPHKSVMGFDGPAYADFIPIDIDSKDLGQAIYQTVRALEILKSHDIDMNVLTLYFSGSKGFHIMIPSELVGAEPGADIHDRFRSFVKRLMIGVEYDSSIYDKVRIFRVPNTLNSKSGKYKIQLYPFELYNATSEDIMTLATEKREEWAPEEAERHEELAELYWQAVDESRPHSSSRTDSTRTEGVRTKLCLHQMMQGVGEGERDNIGLRVATHLKHAGLSSGMIWAALVEWNLLNRPPLSEKDLERIYQQGLKSYDFGCRDHLLAAYCDKKCLFYKEG
ncbi:primase C-terminal domain-containing protein [Cohnella sp. GCM10020058]|uniref:primase C-terminal domain-containing protein n=1 Tax=Cohnella sp. GCM10020058 TaxID=3317330 RepID=UPI00363849DC